MDWERVNPYSYDQHPREPMRGPTVQLNHAHTCMELTLTHARMVESQWYSTNVKSLSFPHSFLKWSNAYTTNQIVGDI